MIGHQTFAGSPVFSFVRSLLLKVVRGGGNSYRLRVPLLFQHAAFFAAWYGAGIPRGRLYPVPDQTHGARNISSFTELFGALLRHTLWILVLLLCTLERNHRHWGSTERRGFMAESVCGQRV